MTLKKLILASCVTLLLAFIIAYFTFDHRYSITNQQSSQNSVSSEKNTQDCPTCNQNKILPTKIPDQTLTLLFAGDLMFDRHIREHAQTHSNDYIFAPIKETLLNSDLVIANLECPITDSKSKSVGSAVGSTNNYIFTCDPSLAKTLTEHNINLVNLGNNHILNFGQNGLSQTHQNLDAHKIKTFGNVGNDDSKRMTIIETKGLKLAFINYNQFVNHSLEYALTDLKKAQEAQADLIIVYPHWGAEYITVANSSMQNLAHQFIDAGADLIIGGHPHVVQQSEIYKGKTIYYSLGNFIFDQYFEENVKNGLLVKVTIKLNDKTMNFSEIKIKMDKTGQTSLATQSAQTNITP